MSQKSKTHVRDTSEHWQPPGDHELSLYGGTKIISTCFHLLVL